MVLRYQTRSQRISALSVWAMSLVAESCIVDFTWRLSVKQISLLAGVVALVAFGGNAIAQIAPAIDAELPR